MGGLGASAFTSRGSQVRALLFPPYGLVVQLVRTPACHAGGRRFEPVLGRHFYAPVAQLVEQRTENPRVGGSIPPGAPCVRM